MISDQDILDANVLWDYHCKKDHITHINNSVIIGLGSYDTRVADHCSLLYSSGINNKIIFSGKRGNWTNKLCDYINLTEASIFAEIAMKHGVSERDIIIEDSSTNIGGNIKFSVDIYPDKLSDVEHIVIVTKPNTLRRAYATFQNLYPEFHHKLLLSSPDYTLVSHSPLLSKYSMISELVGDLERIILYPALGFQIYQDIPTYVMESYIRLKRQGYTEHCLERI